ncbi:hypothetical protein G5C65_25215 [Streptomyces sp. SB3404]|uniref:Uncharacterized protein n=1 Tax=Streptomyces boncukensis TaxID=2711219 RepID=A0A6G4X3Y3_9ACTN|nr:hypothetical protein [Streptomyces boncukensis]
MNPGGGPASLVGVVPAQAIARACELTRQPRRRAGARRIPGKRAGTSADQGLFGHGSAVILTR